MGDFRAEVKPVHLDGRVTGFRWAIARRDVPDSLVESGIEKDFDTAFLRAEVQLNARKSPQRDSG